MPAFVTLNEVVQRELMLEFTTSTRLPLLPDGETELQQFLTKALFPLLDDRKIEWDGRAKKFVLSCAAGLARASEKVANDKNSAVIDRAILIEALVGSPSNPGLIYCWERVCPLPPSDSASDRGVLVGCLVLRGHLGI